ncbi:MAG: fasciclin domain-containing protein [Planctomycetes bacterium]|nr:fasciclin domain-containing protein [Planctomycetota bacterium]
MFALSLAAIALTGSASIASPASTNENCPNQAVAGKNIVETAVAAGSFGTLAAALGAAGLVDTLSGVGPFTVFAPTDAAFAKLPKGTVETLLKPENIEQLKTILTYHVVAGDVRAASVVKMKFASALNGQRIAITADGGGVSVAGAKVATTDVACSNGVIHIVDSVMMPVTKNLVTTAVEAGSFKTLAAALKAADLVDALSGPGPFTVFAPTDEAFAKLPQGTLEKLLKPENKANLVALLKFHVLPGRVYSDQVAAGEVPTLSGMKLAITVEKGVARIGNACLVKADIETCNGVIHVVDSVILPKM